MFANVAYLHNSFPDAADESAPLIVTSCGFYRIHSCPVVSTRRPSGRKDYQLLYVAKGKGHFTLQGRERLVTEGNMVLFRPGEPQLYDYYAADGTEVYWVHFTGSAAGELLERQGFSAGENLFAAGAWAEYHWFFDRMIQELQLCRFGFEEILTLELQQILILAQRHMLEGIAVSSRLEDEIRQATRYFSTHYKEQLSIDAYAASCHMSTCWFIRSFRQIVHMTPMQYILSVRMANAQSLLENTDYPIAEIASAVGYENPLYFSRLFHKHMGVSPSVYRKNKSAAEA